METNSIACVVNKHYTKNVSDQLSRFHLKVDKEENATSSSNVIYYVRGDFVTFILQKFPIGYNSLEKNILIEEMRELQETNLK